MDYEPTGDPLDVDGDGELVAMDCVMCRSRGETSRVPISFVRDHDQWHASQETEPPA